MYNYIKTAIQNLGVGADLYMLNPENNESENLNFERITIRIKTDFRTNINQTKSLELINSTTYTIEFLDLDEWDNSDHNESQSDETTFEIVERMRILANSIFSNIISAQGLYIPNTQNITWSYIPIWRKYNGTMSGVQATFVMPLIDTKICSYGN
jgi:hypothetical protein